MRKIWKGDEVIIIAGKDKGKIGIVLKVLSKKLSSKKPSNEKLLVEGVNIAKKHTKPNPNKNEVGGVVDKIMPIDASNVAIYNTETKKADRIGFRITEDGKKVRFLKSTGKIKESSRG